MKTLSNRNWYVCVNFLQYSEDTEEFDELYKEEKYDDMLRIASDYDFSDKDGLDLRETYKGSPVHYPGDDLVDENDNYAIVVNNSVGGVYAIFRKVTEQELIDEITKQGFNESNLRISRTLLSKGVVNLINSKFIYI